jgi:uncharacterized protein (DUF362 family)
MTKASVAVIYTAPETVLEDYGRLFELAGGAQALDPGATTILKDNITWHYPMPACNTTPWQLEGSIRALRAAGLNDLVCVQNQTVVTNAFKGEDLNGYVPIFRAYGIPVRYNFRPEDMTWVEYHPKAKMLALDHIYPEGIRIPDFFIGKNIVHLPTIKTHMYTTTTGAMKNAFGGLLTKYRHYTHSWIHETLVDLLAIQKEIHPGILALMDGTTAGTGAGPRMVRPVVKNVLLASSDQVAIDAVAAKLMGYDPLSIPYIRMCDQMQLGNGDPRNIEVVGADVNGVNLHFTTKKSFVIWGDQMLRKGPLRFLEKIALHSPLMVWAPAASNFYHDILWYPTVGQAKIGKFNRTEWGRLWRDYKDGKRIPERQSVV